MISPRYLGNSIIIIIILSYNRLTSEPGKNLSFIQILFGLRLDRPTSIEYCCIMFVLSLLALALIAAHFVHWNTTLWSNAGMLRQEYLLKAITSHLCRALIEKDDDYGMLGF